MDRGGAFRRSVNWILLKFVLQTCVSVILPTERGSNNHKTKDRTMTIFKGTKSECIKLMLSLEEVHGRIFWVISMDDAAGTYELQTSEEMGEKLQQATK